MSIKEVLNSPRVYQLFQETGGFFGARLKAIDKLLDIRPGMKVIDIGCGPGYITRHLPAGIEYIGFDVDQTYIDHARQHFGDKGSFHCRFFDDAAAAEFAGADIVMMNGVLHHIPDAELSGTLSSIATALKPGGILFTLDGVFVEGQSSIAKTLLKNDRGQYVRTQEGYEALLKGAFATVEGHIFHDISLVPYSFFVALSRKAT